MMHCTGRGAGRPDGALAPPPKTPMFSVKRDSPNHPGDQMATAPEKVRHPEKVHRPDNPIQRKTSWIRVKAPVSKEYHETRQLMRSLNRVTVCEEAACPNRAEESRVGKEGDR